VIKVPFDTHYHGDSERAQITTRLELERTLDAAYKTMDWFKFLADKAVRVEILGTDKNTHTNTTWVGFELDPKNETFYRLKYDK
jgi:hypothetical protein